MLDPADNLLTSALESVPLIAIFRGMSTKRTVELAERAWDAGITCVEVPVQGEASYGVLEAVVRAGALRGKPVGAGTVVSTEQVRRVAKIGAAFTVSPGFDVAVARSSIDAGLPTLPGVATATDVHHAMRAGLTWLKAFPATALGADWFSAMQGPFPDARMVATGGISSTNAETYVLAGASALAVGSGLTDAAELEKLVSVVGTGLGRRDR